MKIVSDNHTCNGRGQGHAEPPPAMDPGRLVRTAQSYFSEDFDWPSQPDCPSAGEFEALLRERNLPPEDLRKHLFGCSKCFRQFREVIERRRQAAAAGNSPSWRERFGRGRFVPAPAYTLLAGFLLVAAAAFLLLRGHDGKDLSVANGGAPAIFPAPAAVPSPAPPSVSEARVTDTSGAPSNMAAPARATDTTDTAAAVRGRQTQRRAATLGTVLIDLAGYSVLRADDAPSGAPGGSTLKPGPNRLRILLPEGSPPGSYRVAVVDAFGKPLGAERPVRSAGRKVEVTINARGLSGCRCRLRISHGGDAPDYYPINITGR